MCLLELFIPVSSGKIKDHETGKQTNMVEAVEIEAQKRIGVPAGDLRRKTGDLGDECREENPGTLMAPQRQACVEEDGGNGNDNAIQNAEPDGVSVKQDTEGQNRKHDEFRASEKPGDRLWQVFVKKSLQRKRNKGVKCIQKDSIKQDPYPSQWRIGPGINVQEKAKKAAERDLPQKFMPEMPLRTCSGKNAAKVH